MSVDEIAFTNFTRFCVDATNIDEAITKLQEAKEAKLSRLNKLQRHLYGDNRIVDWNEQMISDVVRNKRGCGQTTAQALQIISDAIWQPNVPQKIVDRSNPCDAEFVKRGFRQVVIDLIEKLELKFMHVNHIENTLTLEI